MKSFKEFQEGAGLWANIHKKRKEGRPMRKPGSKGAPTKADFKRAKGEDVIKEVPLVASDSAILDSIWKEVKKVLEKELAKGKTELTNMVARIGKFKITKDKQQKGKAFRSDLKR